MKENFQQEIATPDKKVCNNNRSLTKKIVYVATLVAICIVLKLVSNAVSSFVPSFIKISFTYLGWYMAAAILGPEYGFIVACLSDLIGQWIIPTGGAPNPVLMVGNGLSAFIFGACFKYIKLPKASRALNLAISASIGAAFAAIVCTLGVNTFGIWFYYYNTANYWAFTLTRLVQLPSVVVNVALFLTIMPVLNRLKLIPETEKSGEWNKSVPTYVGLIAILVALIIAFVIGVIAV